MKLLSRLFFLVPSELIVHWPFALNLFVFAWGLYGSVHEREVIILKLILLEIVLLAESRILLMEHKNNPHPLFLYVYIRIG